ncbi:VirB8/TrbF family protein [Shewanella algae]|uniref:VirB8/TrbF family protein n=1 Tax=Shewanella algae TaxID=38313 RepID=UPI001181D46F|nr:VirB8/TrbF family protein [Shewanella algae]TVO83397.1 hypothetical protein AYI80_19470 [Shewanella algae]TXS83014.1 hypothetical protein AYI81_20400 [Shewanella algae]
MVENSEADESQEASILFEKARQDWDERVGSLVQQNSFLKILMLFMALITGGAVLGVVHIGSQSKIEPYVMEKSGDDYTLLGKAKEMGDSEKQRLISKSIREFVINHRTVVTDKDAQIILLLRAYAHLRSSDPAYTQITNFLKDPTPMKRAETEIVKISVGSVIRIGATNTYQVSWVEHPEDRFGKKKKPLYYRANIEYYTSPPKTADELEKNPLGIWVKFFNETLENK